MKEKFLPLKVNALEHYLSFEMRKLNPSAAAIIKQYYPLLLRYATMLIHDPVEAEKIVRQVFEDHYNVSGLAPTKHLREVLKAVVLDRCTFFKWFRILDRPPIKIPPGGYVPPDER